MLGLANLEVYEAVHVGSEHLTLDVNTFTVLDRLTTLTGGVIEALGGLYLDTGSNLTAFGLIEAPFASAVGSTIHASGDLVLGHAASFDGVNLAGRLNIGANTVTLHDGHKAVLGSQTTLGAGGVGGTLNAPNGIALEDNHALVGAGVVNTSAGQFENQGFVQCTGSGITFNHLVTGAGDFGGTCTFLGGTDFGNSPAQIAAGTINFGAANTHYVELGGLAAGSEYDRVSAAGAVNLDGPLAVAKINLGNGYTFAAGDSFQIISAAGGVNGTFSSESLPPLAAGLSWEVHYNPTDVKLLVAAPSATVVHRSSTTRRNAMLFHCAAKIKSGKLRPQNQPL